MRRSADEVTSLLRARTLGYPARLPRESWSTRVTGEYDIGEIIRTPIWRPYQEGVRDRAHPTCARPASWWTPHPHIVHDARGRGPGGLERGRPPSAGGRESQEPPIYCKVKVPRFVPAARGLPGGSVRAIQWRPLSPGRSVDVDVVLRVSRQDAA